MRTVDPTRIVQQGYDDLDDTYRRWVAHTRVGYRSAFLTLLEEVGFSIAFAETVTEVEEGAGPATFYWVIARKPSAGEVQRSP